MIRVTTKEGRVFECLYIRKYNELYMASRDMYSDTYEWRSDIDDIIKIEKQVKDLTKDEIYEYTMYKYDGIRKVMIWADCVEIDLGYEYIELNNDDYVDVTDLYKEA